MSHEENIGKSYQWIMRATGDERERRIRIVADDRDWFAVELARNRTKQEEIPDSESPINTESVNDR